MRRAKTLTVERDTIQPAATARCNDREQPQPAAPWLDGETRAPHDKGSQRICETGRKTGILTRSRIFFSFSGKLWRLWTEETGWSGGRVGPRSGILVWSDKLADFWNLVDLERANPRFA